MKMWKSFSRKIFPHCSNISNLESLKTKRAAHSKIKCIKAQLSAAVHPKDITNTTRSKTHKSYCNKWRGEKKEKGENSRISTTDVLQMLVLQNIVSFLPRLDLFCRCCCFFIAFVMLSKPWAALKRIFDTKKLHNVAVFVMEGLPSQKSLLLNSP